VCEVGSVQIKMDSTNDGDSEQVSSMKSSESCSASNEIFVSPETLQFLEEVFRNSGFALERSGRSGGNDCTSCTSNFMKKTELNSDQTVYTN